MNFRSRVMGLAASAVLLAEGEAAACGDKFLVSGRGTRYQRPKNARAASILIYADPATGLAGAMEKGPLDSVLKREGHRTTIVETAEQLAALVVGGRFDVVLAAIGVVEAVSAFVGVAPDAPVVVAFCAANGGQARAGRSAPCVKTPLREGSLLRAIDDAIAQHDRNARKASRSS